jgi:uncharacterized membrane protein
MATAVPTRSARIDSIDVLRGIVMILMAIDHVRDFFGTAGSPTDLTQTTVALFFTRWITHFCAPVFFLLTGTGAYLMLRRRSRSQLAGFLFTRGLWLIFLELTVLRCFGYQFNVDYRVTFLIVLWALGWSMIALSALVRLPASIVTAVGVAMIATHNLFDAVRPASLGAWAPLWSILHVQGLLVVRPPHFVLVAYPLVPWIGVTAVGYGLGQLFSWPPERRRAALAGIGAGLTALFVLLRAIDGYGDPSPWTVQKSPIFTALSFLNTAKYPPSLLFLLMTLGPALLLLGWLDRTTPRILRPALVFGRVPLFYFVLHLPLIHLVALVVCAIRYGSVHWMFESSRPDQFPFAAPPGWGFSLPVVYAVWIGVVLALYPLCRWFGAVRQRRSDVWLSYL